MKKQHTRGPWKIDWYECRADSEDVKAGTAKKVGDMLWRVPRSIGPISVGENHWAKLHLDVSEEDARLIAAAPELLSALQLICTWHEVVEESSIPAKAVILKDMKKARDIIAKVTGP